MAHAITGKAGAATFASAFNAILTAWNLKLKAESTVDRGAGQAWQSRVYLFSDWDAMIKGYVPDQANRYVFSANEAAFATVGAIALKFKSADVSAFFAASGLFDEFEINSPIDNNIDFSCHVACSEGVAPTIAS